MPPLNRSTQGEKDSKIEERDITWAIPAGGFRPSPPPTLCPTSSICRHPQIIECRYPFGILWQINYDIYLALQPPSQPWHRRREERAESIAARGWEGKGWRGVANAVDK